MQLTRKELDKLCELDIINPLTCHKNHGILYEDNNLIYKISNTKNNFYDEYKRNIEYLIENPIINTPRIYEKIYIGNDVYGYTMENLKNRISFKQAIDQQFDTDIKIKVICDIHKVLKELHSHNIYIGDINLEKLIISNNTGYIVDLDDMRFPGDKYKFNVQYNIKRDFETLPIPTNQYTDVTKLMLSSISLLLNIDLEMLITPRDNSINMEYLYNTIIVATNKRQFIKYFKKILEGEIIYFDDFLKDNGYIKEEKNFKL